MPLVNETFWRERMGTTSPCWSGERWLDWEHGFVMRWAIRRVWPPHPLKMRVLDVGCGDGRWSAWMKQEFGADVKGTDALEYPGVRQRVTFSQCDAEQLTLTFGPGGRWRPELAVCLNSLTCVADWKKAVAQVCKVAPRVIAFDNFQTPTPPWLKGLPHRRPIELPELVKEFGRHGFVVKEIATADWFHRKLFLATPVWLHPLVAVVTLVLDLGASWILPPEKGRHVAVQFVKRALTGSR